MKMNCEVFDNENKMSYYANNNYKQSFNRFCDDLCEIIVSFLSFEDKIYYECVSKQFQRCVCVKQYSIGVNDCVIKQIFDQNIENTLKNYDAFECVLKKYKYINKISIETHIESRDKVLELVLKYCKNLKSIKFDFCEIDEQLLVEFGLKFGQSLEVIKNFRPFTDRESINSFKLMLKMCPNVKTLHNINVETFVTFDQLLPKLENVVNLFISEDKYLEIFVEKYGKSLKSFTTEIPNNYLSEIEAKQNFILRQISKLNTLEVLKLIFNCFDSTLIEIKLIANKCKNLRKLDFDISLKSLNGNQLIETISHFTHLSHLTLRGIEEELNSIEPLKRCHNLKVLKLGHKYITDQFFTNIETIIPQIIELRFGSFGLISDTTFHCLAKLTKLKVLNIDNRRHWPTLTDSGVCDLLDNCRDITSINFRRRPNITHKTIESMITLALRRPKINFKHNLGINYDYFCNYKKQCSSLEEDMIDMSAKLPNNLFIELY